MPIENFSAVLPRFLKVLSICYAIGFLLHIADFAGLRLHFSEMSLTWRIWIIYLVIFDAIAAIGLWRRTKWGIAAFLLIALSQLIAYLAFQSIFGEQTFLIVFHLATLLAFLALKVLPSLRS